MTKVEMDSLAIDLKVLELEYVDLKCNIIKFNDGAFMSVDMYSNNDLICKRHIKIGQKVFMDESKSEAIKIITQWVADIENTFYQIDLEVNK